MSPGAERFLWLLTAELGLEPNFQFPTQSSLPSILSPRALRVFHFIALWP